VHLDDYTDTAAVKKAEDKILKNARKYIDNYCKEYYTTQEDTGPQRKAIFKQSAKLVSSCMKDRFGEKAIFELLGASVNKKMDIVDWLITKICNVVEKKKVNKTYGQNYIDDRLKKLTKQDYKDKVVELQKIYYGGENSMSKQCERLYAERHNVLVSRLRNSINDIKYLFNTNNLIVADVVKCITSDEMKTAELQNLVNEKVELHSIKMESSIRSMKFIYNNMIGNYEYIYRIRSIVEYLKQLRNKRANYVKRPDDIDAIIRNKH
jgi:hypothetical protein